MCLQGIIPIWNEVMGKNLRLTHGGAAGLPE